MRFSEGEDVQMVQDLMVTKVVCATPTTRLPEAARIMLDEDVGMLPVVDTNNVLVGVITDRDIAVRAVAEELDASQTRVEACMTADELVLARPEMELEEVEDMMADHQVRRLPVVDEMNQVVGVITLADIIQHLEELESEEVQAVAELLEDITMPGGEHSQRRVA